MWTNNDAGDSSSAFTVFLLKKKKFFLFELLFVVDVIFYYYCRRCLLSKSILYAIHTVNLHQIVCLKRWWTNKKNRRIASERRKKFFFHGKYASFFVVSLFSSPSIAFIIKEGSKHTTIIMINTLNSLRPHSQIALKTNFLHSVLF